MGIPWKKAVTIGAGVLEATTGLDIDGDNELKEVTKQLKTQNKLLARLVALQAATNGILLRTLETRDQAGKEAAEEILREIEE